MSAGAFVYSKYQNDVNGIHKVKIQPETLLLEVDGIANVAPLGDIDTVGSAKVSKGKKAIGVGCRTVTIRFTGTPPTGYKAGGLLRIPILTSALYTSAITPGATFEYQGVAAELVFASPETRK